MKSVLFLVALSFCASCCLFAEEAAQPQPMPIEESQEVSTPQEQDLACRCGKRGCGGCGKLACGSCKSLLIACPGCNVIAKCSCKDKLMLADCGCKGKGKGKSNVACQCHKPKPVVAPVPPQGVACRHKKPKAPVVVPATPAPVLACECEALETEEAAA